MFVLVCPDRQKHNHELLQLVISYSTRSPFFLPPPFSCFCIKLVQFLLSSSSYLLLQFNSDTISFSLTLAPEQKHQRSAWLLTYVTNKQVCSALWLWPLTQLSWPRNNPFLHSLSPFILFPLFKSTKSLITFWTLLNTAHCPSLDKCFLSVSQSPFLPSLLCFIHFDYLDWLNEEN